MEINNFQYTDAAPFDCESSSRDIMRFNNTDSKITLGEIFLNPTRIYCDPIVDLIHHAKTDEAGFTIEDLRAICHYWWWVIQLTPAT